MDTEDTMTTKTIHTAFRADPELALRLSRAAAREDRSVSYVLRRAVERELARLERKARR